MKDLIDYSRETGAGPMESLAKFPRHSNSSPAFQNQSDGQLQQKRQNSNSEHSVQAAAVQLTSTMSTPSVNNVVSSVPASSTSTIAGLLHQNSMNSRQQNPMSSANSPYGGNSVQMSSPATMPASFHSPTPSSSNNPQLASTNSPNVSMQDADANYSQSSVQKIIQDMIMSPQFGAGGEVKNMNGNSHILFGSSNGVGQSSMVSVIRAALGHNLSMNGRVSMAMGRKQGMSAQQQQDMSNQLLNGVGAVDGFNNLHQFEWKSSP